MSPRLTRGRRWPQSARTGCAGCSGRTGTAGWRHRWSRLGGVPQKHLHREAVGRESSKPAQLGPEHHPGSSQGSPHPWAEAGTRSLYLAHRGAAPGCCWGSRPGSPPRSSTARSCPGEGREGERMDALAATPGPSRGARQEPGSCSRQLCQGHSQSTCHRKALGRGSPSPCRATTRESLGW